MEIVGSGVRLKMARREAPSYPDLCGFGRAEVSR